MEDTICEGTVIKINWMTDVYFEDNGICKFKDTNIHLNGIYEAEEGTIRHFKNGKYHNKNGPAHIAKSWYISYRINNKLHRIDVPAYDLFRWIS